MEEKYSVDFLDFIFWCQVTVLVAKWVGLLAVFDVLWKRQRILKKIAIERLFKGL